MGALERIEDSLAETSAVLTGLVPQIELGPFVRSQPTVADVSVHDRMIETVATVSVRNTGAHTVDPVKLGIDAFRPTLADPFARPMILPILARCIRASCTRTVQA